MTNTTAKSTQAAEEQLKWAGTGGGAGSKGAMLGEESGQEHLAEEQLKWAGTGGGAGSKGAMLGEEVDREHRSEDNETHAN